MPTIEEIKNASTVIGRQYDVDRIFLFGSYVRGENNEASDIDLRIDKGRIRGLFQLCGFKNQLEDSLGRKVDVLTTQSLDEKFLQHIAGEEMLIFET